MGLSRYLIMYASSSAHLQKRKKQQLYPNKQQPLRLQTRIEEHHNTQGGLSAVRQAPDDGLLQLSDGSDQ